MKILLAALLLLVTFPVVVGTAAATVASAPHPTPAVRLFSWVPADGFPDRFPFGQCTWWAAYNRKVTWNGNAADWLAEAFGTGVLHPHTTLRWGRLVLPQRHAST